MYGCTGSTICFHKLYGVHTAQSHVRRSFVFHIIKAAKFIPTFKFKKTCTYLYVLTAMNEHLSLFARKLSFSIWHLKCTCPDFELSITYMCLLAIRSQKPVSLSVGLVANPLSKNNRGKKFDKVKKGFLKKVYYIIKEWHRKSQPKLNTFAWLYVACTACIQVLLLFYLIRSILYQASECEL